MKLFVSDLDGTLLNRNFEISAANREAIHLLQKKGFRFVVATGRIYHDAATICRNYDLSPYIIANNGACIFDEEGNQIYGRWITSQNLREIITYLEKIQVCYGIGTSEEYIAPSHWEDVLDQETKRLKQQGIKISDKKLHFTKYEMISQNGFRVMNIIQEIENRDLTCYSVSVVTHDQEVISKIIEFTGQYPKVTATVSGSHNLEIMSQDGTKGNALKYLADMLKIRVKSITAIGDSFNDLTMLEYAKTSIAMGNAEEEIKAICTYCTGECTEDGFAAAVKELLDKGY